MSSSPPAEALDVHDARALLTTLVDNSGMVRAKAVPGAKIASSASRGIGLSPVFAVMCFNGDILDTGAYGGPAGDMRLIPDLAAAACLDEAEGLWWAPVDQRSQELETLPSCQRSVLRRQCEDAASKGLDFLMTFELEFTVFSGDRDAPAFAHAGPAYGLQAFIELEPFLLDLIDAFTRAGLEPELVHPEYGPGQVEFSMAPADPLTAADRQVLSRLLTRRVAQQHGLRVSFSPVTQVGAVGNGCHVHFSAYADGVNVFAPDAADAPGPGRVGGSMIAGVVAHLPGATGLLAPSLLSYHRLIPQHWAGAYACWGTENREAAVRFIPGTVTERNAAANCEVKMADSTGNPYLAAAAILAMALDGADRQLPLPTTITVDPHTLAEDERERLGVRRLPASLTEALDLLSESRLMPEALGRDLLDAFIAVRRHEGGLLSELDDDELVASTRWLY